jgi:hypothetical protein
LFECLYLSGLEWLIFTPSLIRGSSDETAISCGIALLAAYFPLASALAQDTATEVDTDIGTLYPDETAPLYKPPGYSPCAGRNYPARVLWGDTHLHTANSLDAAAFGNTALVHYWDTDIRHLGRSMNVQG